jgi:hypothetical protein
MKFLRLRRAALCGAALFLLASCGEPSPVSVEPRVPAPNRDLLGDSLALPGLLTCTPLAYDSTTQVVGVWGGVISVGPHVLVIPFGALSAPTTITAVVRPDTVDAVHFEPQGLQFSRPAYLLMNYANCNLLGLLTPRQIAYTSDSLDVLEIEQSWDNPSTLIVTGQIRHFSEYAVAW